MKTTILIAVTLFFPFAPRAADEIKPLDVKVGLWETTVTSETSGMANNPGMPQIPADKLAQLPPEQRARIEGMLKTRGMGGAQTTTHKMCLTKEALNRPLNFSQDNSCTQKLVSSSSSKEEVHVECTRDTGKSSGDMTIERVDSEHVKGGGTITGAMKMPNGNTQPLNMKVSWTAKWIASDCGDVKPMGEK